MPWSPQNLDNVISWFCILATCSGLRNNSWLCVQRLLLVLLLRLEVCWELIQIHYSKRTAMTYPLCYLMFSLSSLLPCLLFSSVFNFFSNFPPLAHNFFYFLIYYNRTSSGKNFFQLFFLYFAWNFTYNSSLILTMTVILTATNFFCINLNLSCFQM